MVLNFSIIGAAAVVLIGLIVLIVKYELDAQDYEAQIAKQDARIKEHEAREAAHDGDLRDAIELGKVVGRIAEKESSAAHRQFGGDFPRPMSVVEASPVLRLVPTDDDTAEFFGLPVPPAA